ncbi:peptidoglycan DD-metalloendopeptidase family protein [Devosia sp. D6-9]|nr:peptidoglycan DD-metalloendopeptidase family protein [Devosia sp. D6-9]
MRAGDWRVREETHAKRFGRSRKDAGPKKNEAGISPRLFYCLVAGLLATNALTLVGFLMSPDISAIINGQNGQVISAYEERVAQLRLEVDRLHSRNYAQAGDINLQLQEITQQQEVLTEQHQYVKALAEKANELGLTTAAPVQNASLPAPASPVLAGTTEEQAAAAASNVQQMLDESRTVLASISQSATQSTDAIVTELQGIGIRPNFTEDAVGGPLLPPVAGAQSDDLVDDANTVMSALLRFKSAREAIDAAPVHKPFDGVLRQSSTFGNRRDPFTGRSAFHSGIDFPAPSGTSVLSAGAGKVTFVGQQSGYGNMIEIDHGNGLITRYAHLSAFLVKEGQVVATGSPIAKVGSTGRSTGPHLHFEVRRDENAVNPQQFLNVGTRLQQFAAV